LDAIDNKRTNGSKNKIEPSNPITLK